jgi:hypothetical protein
LLLRNLYGERPLSRSALSSLRSDHAGCRLLLRSLFWEAAPRHAFSPYIKGRCLVILFIRTRQHTGSWLPAAPPDGMLRPLRRHTPNQAGELSFGLTDSRRNHALRIVQDTEASWVVTVDPAYDGAYLSNWSVTTMPAGPSQEYEIRYVPASVSMPAWAGGFTVFDDTAGIPARSPAVPRRILPPGICRPRRPSACGSPPRAGRTNCPSSIL